MNAAELLEFLVGIESVSGNEKTLADAFSAWLTQAGFDVQRSGNNLWFEVGAGKPRLLMNSHIDTVPPASGWTRDPFRGRWGEDSRLYALGANDAKGCVAAMTMAAVALRSNVIEGTAIFAFTAEEETGGAGIATILDAVGPLDAAIIGEPTGLAACIAQRGMLILRCSAQGEAGHVAHAANAMNAIHMAARDIALLQTMKFPVHPVLGEVRAQVTQISGGQRRNQIPESCEFHVDIRTTPDLDHEELAARIARQLESGVHVHSSRYLPKATSPDASIVGAVIAAGANGCTGSATTSDWAFLASDIPAVKIGPGDTRRSHSADEYLERVELDAAVVFYTRAVQRYFREAQHVRAA